MRDPEMKATLLGEGDIAPEAPGSMENVYGLFEMAAPVMYPLGNPVDYEPGLDQSIGALAAAEGREAIEFLYDWMLEDDGSRFASLSTVDVPDRMNVLREMLVHPDTVTGLSDAGAHVTLICDGTMPTTQLSYWARDRRKGEQLPVEFLVHKQTARNAASVRLRRPRHARGRQARRRERDRSRRPHRVGAGRPPRSAGGRHPPAAAGVRLCRHRVQRGTHPGERHRHRRPARPAGAQLMPADPSTVVTDYIASLAGSPPDLDRAVDTPCGLDAAGMVAALEDPRLREPGLQSVGLQMLCDWMALEGSIYFDAIYGDFRGQRAIRNWLVPTMATIDFIEFVPTQQAVLFDDGEGGTSVDEWQMFADLGELKMPLSRGVSVPALPRRVGDVVVRRLRHRPVQGRAAGGRRDRGRGGADPRLAAHRVVTPPGRAGDTPLVGGLVSGR